MVNEKYKLWLAKGKNDHYAKCVLCSKEIDLSTMGANDLDSHAKGKKHCDIVKNRSAGLVCSWWTGVTNQQAEMKPNNVIYNRADTLKSDSN